MEASSLTLLSPRTPEAAAAETGLEAARGEHRASWLWALGELLVSRCDLEELEDASRATGAQRGQACGSDRPQEGKALEKPKFWRPGAWWLSQL